MPQPMFDVALEDGIIRQSNFTGKGHHPYKESKVKWSEREFIAWDGEGTAVNEPMEFQSGIFYDFTTEKTFVSHERTPQPYVLLANSKGGRITSETGLSTIDCLEFILDTKKYYLDSVFVGFGFDYDVNQILKDIHPNSQWSIYKNNVAHWRGYRIKYIPHKFFTVSHKKTKRSATIYDTFTFFQMSFLKTCENYLGKDDPELSIIKEGKEHRTEFEWNELEDYIIPYNQTELSMLVRVMNIFRQDLDAADIHPRQWYGPGAVANEVLAQFNIIIARNIPREVNDAATFAYAGGRVEQFRVGRDEGPVYQYDIRSAYPAAATQLPDLSAGTWEHVKGFQPDTFGVWHIEYWGPGDNGPRPLFCRAQDGSICYPNQVSGWYWTPEANLCPDNVREGFVFHPKSSRRPFQFVEEMYRTRQEYKRDGNTTERALKLVLNSLYGKLAQTIGWNPKTKLPPKWHQYEWAGYITSYTRAKIYQAMMQRPSAIIAAETDAVFSTVPLQLPESNQLGDWEMTKYDSIVYLQSGFYYAVKGEKVICKYRGMDRDRATEQPIGLPYWKVLDHLRYETGFSYRPTPALRSHTTRFIGLGLGLRTESVWRSWETKSKVISLDQRSGSSKRVHIANQCDRCCDWHVSMYEQMHPLVNAGHGGISYARSLPWKEHVLDEFHFDWTMDSDFRDFAEDMDRWQ